MMSWISFFFEVLVGLVIMILPGALSLVSLGARRLTLPVFSPSVSLVLYVLLGVVLHSLGVSASGVLLVVLSCVPALAIFLIRLIVERRHSFGGSSNGLKRRRNGRQHSGALHLGSLQTYALYIVAGIIACGFFFVIPLDGPDSFSSSSDNAYHLSLVRSFLDSRSFCTLHCSVFPDTVGGGTFYPAAWHVLAAIVADFFGGAVPAAANVINALVLFYLFPSGFFCLLGNYFGTDTRRHRFGAVACLCFSAFPWGFLNWGQLAPLLLAFSLVPLFVYLFRVIVLSNHLPTSKAVLILAAVFVALAFAHPSSVFTAGVFSIPSIYQSLCGHVVQVPKCIKRARKPFLLSATVALVAFVWVAAYHLPFLGSVVGYQWGGDKTLIDASLSALFNCFGGLQAPQYLLGFIVLIGFVVAIRARSLRFLNVTYLFILVLYIVNSVTTAGVQHLLTGFWYTDPYRIGAMLVMAEIPFACLGFDAISMLIGRLVDSKTARFAQFIIPVGLILLIFTPNVSLADGTTITTGFGRMVDHLAYSYSLNSAYSLDAQERDFINLVKKVTGGERIINCPYDGSMYLYGATGLNVQYRTFKGQVDKSDLIPGKLNRVTINQPVRTQVEQTGAQYVLLLDADWPISGTADQNIDISAWEGVANITETTPGFDLVLAEGDMRLFKITGYN